MLMAGMIVLNEEEYLEANLRQHYCWVDHLVIVEGADVHYPRDRVSESGLSLDRTAEIVRSFPDPDHKITFIQNGWAGDGREGHGKTVLRDRYAEHFRRFGLRGWLLHLDADEFFLQSDHAQISQWMQNAEQRGKWALRLPTVHFWHGFDRIVTGGYYDIDHVRFFRFQGDMAYRYSDEGSHNWPKFDDGTPVHRRGLVSCRRSLISCRNALSLQHNGRDHDGPCCYHFGFAKSEQSVLDKTRYYENRGEGVSRPGTIADRRSWFVRDWDEAGGLCVFPWGGSIPEALRGRS